MQSLIIGAGCFWCVDAVFHIIKGVHGVIPGYAGGNTDNPTYDDICTGTTGHAEVCKIQYDPSVIGEDMLLKVFWTTHDPTTLNRQGNDVGTQYRSVIYYENEAQESLAERLKKDFAEQVWDAPIVTEIEELDIFYPAEAYHHNYYINNPNQGYCNAVINPKLSKFRKIYSEILK